MKLKILFYLCIFLGFLEIILLYFEVPYSLIIHPLCVVLLYAFYIQNVKRHNFFLLLYLTCELINEVFFIIDFNRYFSLVMASYVLATFTMIYHLWPIYKQTKFNLDGKTLLSPIVGIIGVFYIFLELTFLVIANLPNNYIFFPALAALVCWVFFCSFIPIKNRHPQNSVLFFMGGAMAVMAPTMFIYTYLWENTSILILSLFSMITLKVSLVWYLINFDSILEGEESYF